VALAESCSGGYGADLLSAVAGASAWFIGSAVSYHPRMKQRWAGVSESTLAAHGAVSREVTLEMAAGVRAQAEASYGVAITGYAGPDGGTEADPVGTYYCAIASADGTSVVRERVDGERDRVRQFAAYRALDLLRRALLGAA
jgi:PncC family amidohydrolase